jgi:hypothetical protein
MVLMMEDNKILYVFLARTLQEKNITKATVFEAKRRK